MTHFFMEAYLRKAYLINSRSDAQQNTIARVIFSKDKAGVIKRLKSMELDPNQYDIDPIEISEGLALCFDAKQKPNVYIEAAEPIYCKNCGKNTKHKLVQTEIKGCSTPWSIFSCLVCGEYHESVLK